MTVINWQEQNIIDDGCGGLIYKILDNNNCKLSNVEMAMCIFAPEEIAMLHYHEKMEEIYFIIDGAGEIELDGIWYSFKANDAIAIPIMTKHRIRNTSKTQDLKFISVNSPGWDADDTNRL